MSLDSRPRYHESFLDGALRVLSLADLEHAGEEKAVFREDDIRVIVEDVVLGRPGLLIARGDGAECVEQKHPLFLRNHAVLEDFRVELEELSKGPLVTELASVFNTASAEV